MRACLSLHQHPILWLFIHGHTEKLNPTSLDFSHFFCCSCLQLLLLTFYWALFQFKNFRESIIQMGNSYQGIREHVDTLFKFEKFAVIAHAIEKKNRKKCITLWHWAVIECNANNYSTGWNFGHHVFIAIVYRSWFHNNHHVLTHFPILASSWSACVSADDLVNDCFESCQSICQILFRRMYQLACTCLFSLYCEITILSIIICKICLEECIDLYWLIQVTSPLLIFQTTDKKGYVLFVLLVIWSALRDLWICSLFK